MTLVKKTFKTGQDQITVSYNPEEVVRVNQAFGDKGDRYKYRLKVSVRNEDHAASRVFDFFGSIHDYNNGTKMDEESLGFALTCILRDALSGEMTLEDFCSEFGYEPYDPDRNKSRASAVHQQCTTTFNFFESNGLDLYEFVQYLSEEGYD